MPRKMGDHWDLSCGRCALFRKMPFDVPPRRNVAGIGLRVVNFDLCGADRETSLDEVRTGSMVSGIGNIGCPFLVAIFAD